MALDHHTAHSANTFRKLPNADKWKTIEPDYKAFGCNMSALAKSLGLTREAVYKWKRAHDKANSLSTTEHAKRSDVERAWGRQSILTAKRAISKLQASIQGTPCGSCNGIGKAGGSVCDPCEGTGKLDRAVITAGDMVCVLALLAGDDSAFDQLPELLKAPLAKAAPKRKAKADVSDTPDESP